MVAIGWICPVCQRGCAPKLDVCPCTTEPVSISTDHTDQRVMCCPTCGHYYHRINGHMCTAATITHPKPIVAGQLSLFTELR